MLLLPSEFPLLSAGTELNQPHYQKELGNIDLPKEALALTRS
jgi:hypothetical protein